MNDATALQCPFCTSALPEAAIRCPACGEDVALIMPALRRLQAHDAEIAALREHVALLRQPSDPASAELPRMREAQGWIGPVFLATLLSYALLVGVHYLAVIQFDLPNILLRLASIAIPFGVVMLVPRVAVAPQQILILSGVMLGVAAAMSMSAVVAAVDGVALVPRDARGQRELAEYMCSMALAHIAGGMILRVRHNLLVSRAVRPSMTDKAVNAQRLAEAALPVTALLASLYGGLRALWS